jgi:hypothetical protein
MNDAAVTALVDEVTEYLRVGPVGLYEFMWILRSDAADLKESELADHARAALRRLLDSRQARLVWQRWANVEYQVDATDVEIDDAAWTDPTDDPYLAVVAAR